MRRRLSASQNGKDYGKDILRKICCSTMSGKTDDEENAGLNVYRTTSNEGKTCLKRLLVAHSALFSVIMLPRGSVLPPQTRTRISTRKSEERRCIQFGMRDLR